MQLVFEREAALCGLFFLSALFTSDRYHQIGRACLPSRAKLWRFAAIALYRLGPTSLSPMPRIPQRSGGIHPLTPSALAPDNFFQRVKNKCTSFCSFIRCDHIIVGTQNGVPGQRVS
jgi:hypothetical protein